MNNPTFDAESTIKPTSPALSIKSSLECQRIQNLNINSHIQNTPNNPTFVNNTNHNKNNLNSEINEEMTNNNRNANYYKEIRQALGNLSTSSNTLNNSSNNSHNINNNDNESPNDPLMGHSDIENSSKSTPNFFSSSKFIVFVSNILKVVKKYIKFIGPGIMVSVAYMDPGNYSTAVAAGAHFKYKLLFSVLLSNIMAIFLQSLSCKLGAITGLNLAQLCKLNLPFYLNIFVYVLTELAIIATDLAEVVGTAIALNILFNIPLIIGVLLTIIDVLIVLLAYKPNGPLFIIRIFEFFVTFLVISTVVCFTVELFDVSSSITSVKELFEGFLPSKIILHGDGLYLSLAILGATVMPHSLYLGSGLVQARLKDYDIKNNNYAPPSQFSYDNDELDENYRPSMNAINDTIIYSITELIISLLTVALFVNSSILIVAGATLADTHNSNDPSIADSADLFSIYELLCTNLSKTAGFVFALALLFSGQSAGIVCTLAGQMVSEGFLNWSFPPALRRLITRSIAIIPCFLLVLITGRSGLSNALNFSQVLLSLLLPIVSAPLIYFTANKKTMRVPITRNDNDSNESIRLSVINNSESHNESDNESDVSDSNRLLNNIENDNQIIGYKDMSNSLLTNIISVIIWLFITSLNIYLLFSFILGKDVRI
ncbi:divalent metal ion transporter SMF2 [Ascoidea rubescens DSM 1968]|uniref:Natural resistance-associated macrophage protein n=1 Tax=Ascoidea rubescens DSM 1968 TaxID=1344418 RepID=A0A1D2VH53_9ASCO|nr:natural resistance-associated macrophage protein [Ascoidea rubescens DSM 1968]ODV60988.1 natural resistance-associated macrophage protein [Ascoidea rubescens DSM 1968]